MYWSFWDDNLSYGQWIAWVVCEVLSLIFLILFIRTYLRGLKEIREDHGVFQRLRLTCILLLICQAFWPFYYLLEVKHSSHLIYSIFKAVFAVTGSLYDATLPILLSLISLRIFRCYYNLQCQNLPNYYLIIVFLYLITTWFVVPLEILHFIDKHDKTIKEIYSYYSLVWVWFELAFFLSLLSIVYKMRQMLSHSYEYSVMSSNMIMLESNNKTIELLLKRMLYLLMGFAFYIMLIMIGYFFVYVDGSNIETTLEWIIIHDVFAHSMLHITLLYYVKIDNNYSKNDLENVAGATVTKNGIKIKDHGGGDGIHLKDRIKTGTHGSSKSIKTGKISTRFSAKSVTSGLASSAGDLTRPRGLDEHAATIGDRHNDLFGKTDPYFSQQGMVINATEKGKYVIDATSAGHNSFGVPGMGKNDDLYETDEDSMYSDLTYMSEDTAMRFYTKPSHSAMN